MCELVEDSILVNFNQLELSEYDGEIEGMDIINGLMVRIERANTEGFNIKILESTNDQKEGKVKVVIHLRSSQSFYDLLTEIWIDVRNKKLQCRSCFLENEKYVLIESTQKRRMICRKLTKFNNDIEQSGLKFILNMETGKLMILTINDESSMFISKDMLWFKIKAQIKLISEVYSKYSTELFHMMNKEKYKQYLLKNNGSEELKRIKKEEHSYTKLCKQLEVSHVNFGFSCRADEASFPTLEKSEYHLSQLKEFILNTTHDLFERPSRKLYCTNFEEYLDVPFHMINYEIEHSQSKLYSSYLKTPVPRDPNPGENKFIFNHIEIIKPESVRFQDTQHEGGSSKITVSKLSFYYCESACSTKKFSEKKSVMKEESNFKYPSFYQGNNYEDIEEKKVSYVPGRQAVAMLTKMIGVKVPYKKGKEGWNEKYENEKNIIKLLKSGVSAFILKYYISKQMEFSYRNCLLMDFLPSSQPLSNYMEIYSNTLSLNSKSYLLVNIANSLRFLNDYQVVHMDLGLNNILVYRDYLIKLIDFGEAYSQNVNTSDGKYLKRGYTFPFCSPEYFERKNNFTIKQDIFSFAIIAWKIIFNDYMFFPSEKTLKSYQNKRYLKKIFLAPERGEFYANEQTIYLIYQLLFKCLHSDELLRCEPSWLTIFFKIIYFYLL